jgi:hypothetical protein
MEKPNKKSKAHQRYKNKAGDIVVGTTTITGLLPKNGLVKWANNLGLQGIDSTKYVDSLASIGTLAHDMIEADLMGTKPDLSESSPDEISKAENCLLKYYEWRKEHKIDVIFCEKQLVSEEYQYGGCVDVYCNLNGIPTLIDIKTSKQCFLAHKCQLLAYRQLLEENGYPIHDLRILRVGRDENEGFDDIKVSNQKELWEIFKDCLKLHYDLKKVKEF